MIGGILHSGSGLGNQLHRVVATKVLALDKGYEWGMCGDRFKGESFMDLEINRDVNSISNTFHEKRVEENGVDIRGYDPEINFVEDNTMIDGEFQDERYWIHREDEVREWLAVEPLEMDDDLCVIGFRGGEFTAFPDLFLTKDYWDEAVEMMFKINPKMKFEVHTDDPETAKKFFPDYKCIHAIGINWRSMRYAKYAIIANSSFYILPRWLRGGELLIKHESIHGIGLLDSGMTIAPRGWARRNLGGGIWALPQNYYSRFKYI